MRRAARLPFFLCLLLLSLACVVPAAEASWSKGRAQAFSLLEKGNAIAAYRLAAQAKGNAAVLHESQFVAGWIALRTLGKPDRALRHFQAMLTHSHTGGGKAMALYWMARSLDSMGNSRSAAPIYEIASGFSQEFYGQASAAKLNRRPLVEATAEASFSTQEFARFLRRPEVQEVRGMVKTGKTSQASARLRKLASSGARAAAMTASLANALDLPSVAVDLARSHARSGTYFPRHGYPQIEPHWFDPRTGKAMTLAIVREESGFRQTAVSSAGARGSMQVMDNTARHVGNITGIPIDLSMMRTSRDYNIAVGSYYYATLLEEFDNNHIISLAAYNAGPGRARDWIKRFGDPRRGEIDIIDWIERIPFSETRRYVKRVMSSYLVYLSLLSN